MRLSLKISHKGYLLVGLTLCFELVLVAALVAALQRADQEIKREIHSKSVIACASMLERYAVDGAAAAGAYTYRRTAYFKRRVAAAQDGYMKESARLRELLKDDPKQLARLNETKGMIDQGISFLSLILTNADDDYSFNRLLATPREFKTTWAMVEKLMGSMNEIIDPERQVALESVAEQEKNRVIVQVVVIVIVVLNVAICLGLAFVFTRQIIDRLNNIRENTERLAAGVPLNEPLAGEDEIVQLDHFFHSMANQLKQAEQEKEQLVSMVGHDLRAPLTSVRAVLTMLDSGVLGELNEKGKSRVSMADSELERLIKLINDLLAVEKISSGRFEIYSRPIEIASVMHKSANAVRSMAQEKSIEIDVKDCSLLAQADDERLIQVLVNFLSNAIKFSPEGSTISIEAEQVDGWVETRVRDQGRGVPQELARSIFDRFRQVDRKDELSGSGLGLSICKTIIEKHGGFVGVLPNSGGGSIFWFRVPIADAVVSSQLQRS